MAQRTSYLAQHSSLFGADGGVNYDYIVTNSTLLTGSKCIPNCIHTNPIWPSIYIYNLQNKAKERLLTPPPPTHTLLEPNTHPHTYNVHVHCTCTFHLRQLIFHFFICLRCLSFFLSFFLFFSSQVIMYNKLYVS